MAKRFEDIIVWQKAKVLCILIYKIFFPLKDYSFRDQIQRAAVSIMNNIAEGAERQTDKEMKQFLFIAKGSAGEVRSMISLAKELNYIDIHQYEDMMNQSTEISRMLSGFIKKL